MPPGELDPDLAKALGIDEQTDEAERGVIKYGEESARKRIARSIPEGGVSAFGSAASQQSLDRLLREGRAEFRERDGAAKSGRRTARRGRINPRAAAASSSNPTSIRRATSRRRSPNWSKA